ncbi:MAG TPA: YebC/PmpR family DNA-binding transcriptional regulator, partial [Pseudomonas sp.]|nr:YebC/PmpR family DNA-binding transcriptional regulator [Pseudomonas sp.]
FITVSEALTAAGFVAEEAEVTMIPTLNVELDLEGAEKVMRLIDALEDLDDVQNVYSNAEIPDDVMEQL